MGEVKRYALKWNGGHPGIFQTDDGEFIARSDYTRLERERDESRRAFERAEADVQALVRERDALKQQAECHAMEARTANATIAEIYQAVTGATGEPGNWNGAVPVVAELTRLRAVEAAANAYVESIRQCLDPEDPPELLALAEACGRKG